MSLFVLCLAAGFLGHAHGQGGSPFWRSYVVFPDDPLSSQAQGQADLRWVKFTIPLDPCEPPVVYFQDSQTYVFHYDFATAHLEPFQGMTPQQFNAVTLTAQQQQAALGAVIWPPAPGFPPEPALPEYGIQLVRQDPYSREEIRDLFHRVVSSVQSPEGVTPWYFPTYEQQDLSEEDRLWLASEGVPVGSVARWSTGNTCYVQGWAHGTFKYLPPEGIDAAYQSGMLDANDILLTDALAAEVPQVAGLLSLAPATPNSHVAILAATWQIPMGYLALAADVDHARTLVGKEVILTAYRDAYDECHITLYDVSAALSPEVQTYLDLLKQPPHLDIVAIQPYGAYGIDADELGLGHICYVGGKAAHYGLLRDIIPDHCPRAMALTFDLWSDFFDQPLDPVEAVTIEPGAFLLLWADGQPEQGPTHLGFRLSRSGESVTLADRNGQVLDTVSFGPLSADVSWGRGCDGQPWHVLPYPTPGWGEHLPCASDIEGLVITELMADNENTVYDADEPGSTPDWIELYNGSDQAIELNGFYLSDDPNDPTVWQIPLVVTEPTLRQEIARRLGASAPQHPGTTAPQLAAIRSLFINPLATQFSAEQRLAVLNALGDPNLDFDTHSHLRFRSSTNVEDSEHFSGAGLYESFSGCLADALDTDNTGPCWCDSDRDDERDVFWAIRRVFASFYSDNAYWERRRFNLDESQVGMAVLVHHSFPDEIELANGVATLERKGPGQNSYLSLVTQDRAGSVANPQSGAMAEQVTARIYPSGSIGPPRLEVASNLVRLGQTVMDWPTDYEQLRHLIQQVSLFFSDITAKIHYTLDLEYKKTAPNGAAFPNGGLVIKQLRQVPEPNEDQTLAPVLLEQVHDYEIFTGEMEFMEKADVFAVHRLKASWQLQTRNTLLTPDTLAESVLRHITLEFADAKRLPLVSGTWQDVPGYSHTWDVNGTVDQWEMPDGIYQLHVTGIPTAVSMAENPFVTLADLGRRTFNLPIRCLRLDVAFDEPVPYWHQQVWSDEPESGLMQTTTNRVYLWPRPTALPEDIAQSRQVVDNGVLVDIAFYFPPPPSGFADWTLHTAPLKRFDSTTIEGLTSEPILLTNATSQTYKPEHHNLVEHLLFEPQLDQDVPLDTLDELRDRNVKWIHVIIDRRHQQSQIHTYGF